MLGRGTLIGDAIRDYEREQAILSIGRRLASIRMTESWRTLINECIPEGCPVDSAWQAIVGECLRYLVNARAITGTGLTIAEVSGWVMSLAERHEVKDLKQSHLERLARDLIVVGFMASGEQVRAYSMRDGRLSLDHAPAIVEEREPGVYQPTLEAMDFAFRNLDYERAYGEAFHAKDIMLRRQVESGNYENATDQVRGLRRVISMVRAEYTRMMDDGAASMSPAQMRASLETLSNQMETISASDDLERISERLEMLASSGSRPAGDKRLADARVSLRQLMQQVNDARADVHDVMGLRPLAESCIEEHLSQGMAVKAQGRTVDLSRLLAASTAGTIDVDDLLGILLTPASRPAPTGRIVGWTTLVAASGGSSSELRDGGVDMTTLASIVDERRVRVDSAKESIGASLVAALEEAELSGGTLSLIDWLGSASEAERCEWIETGVLAAFLHSLHTGRDSADGASGWKEWLGGRLADRRLALVRADEGDASVDAWSSEGALGWEFEFEGRRIAIVG